MVRHVILLNFKDSTTPAQQEEMLKAFAALQDKIDTIIGFEGGTSVSPENMEQGYTHCFIISFEDEEGRDVYLPHPAHQKFVDTYLPILDQVVVFDFIDGNYS